MDLRPSLAKFSFDAKRFDELRAQVSGGTLDPAANRLLRAPAPLAQPPVDLRPGAAGTNARREALGARGERAIRAGRVAILVLNGGMATRFGGGAKGVVPVIDGQPRTSFLAVKLGQVHTMAHAVDASIPVVLMHSFATQAPSVEHLDAIDWSGIPSSDRYSFAQSVMPRMLPDGTALATLPEAAELPDTALFCAPGHGDTLGRLRDSQTLATLRQRGVEHILVSNVDNLGASLDPVVLGAHLEQVDRGAGVSVEVVRREAGDAGGCVARIDDGTAAIVEGFRLPAGVDVTDYPHFNTNTLWLHAESVDHDIPLTWFAVRKQIDWPDTDRSGGTGRLDVVQLERLIGQVTESIPSAYLEVDRRARFCPIKVRDDLRKESSLLEGFARAAGVGRSK